MISDKSNGGATQKFGERMPGFSLPSISDFGARTLGHYVKGKTGAVIIFWSAVCTHCRRYDEYFDSFARVNPQLGFATIASRYGETPAQIERAMRQRELTFPVLLDRTGEVAHQWHAQQTPRCYLVTADERLAYRGAIDNFKLRSDPAYVSFLKPAIHSYLTGQPIAREETASFGCAIGSTYYHLPSQL